MAGNNTGLGNERMKTYGGGRRQHETTNKILFLFKKDGSEFHFPPSLTMKSDPKLLPAFKASIGCLGGYSVDENRTFLNDRSYMNFLATEYLPEEYSTEKKVHFDLTLGQDETHDYTGTPLRSLHNFLAWILNNDDKYKKFVNTPTNGGGKFVFQKNIITQLLLTPYQWSKPVTFYATCREGIIFLTSDVDHTSLSYSVQGLRWGHKFEQYILAEERKKLVCNVDYRSVVLSRLGLHLLLYSGAVDCFNPAKFDPKMKDLSAALTLKCWGGNPEYLERSNMLMWCATMVSVGIPEILVGRRNDEGIVHSLKLYDEKTLRESGKKFWDLNKSATFTDKLLSFVKTRTESEPGAVFMFEREAKFNHFTCSKIEKDFIPSWFTNEILS